MCRAEDGPRQMGLDDAMGGGFKTLIWVTNNYCYQSIFIIYKNYPFTLKYEHRVVLDNHTNCIETPVRRENNKSRSL